MSLSETWLHSAESSYTHNHSDLISNHSNPSQYWPFLVCRENGSLLPKLYIICLQAEWVTIPELCTMCLQEEWAPASSTMHHGYAGRMGHCCHTCAPHTHKSWSHLMWNHCLRHNTSVSDVLCVYIIYIYIYIYIAVQWIGWGTSEYRTSGAPWR